MPEETFIPNLLKAKEVIGSIIKKRKGACGVFCVPNDESRFEFKFKIAPVGSPRFEGLVEAYPECWMGVYTGACDLEYMVEDITWMKRRMSRMADARKAPSV